MNKVRYMTKADLLALPVLPDNYKEHPAGMLFQMQSLCSVQKQLAYRWPNEAVSVFVIDENGKPHVVQVNLIESSYSN